mmetsp:Transcript_7520/g.13588  ORF Transcript_7520/g.13588 Transcript_7520/m.13588 type:complete len:238 (-) Transcript_7520:973-1686(-)|eukprot:CAMPEP_0182444230 /NCGR_PEP_ID=MMETSP1172-20130603/2751_1 /TAXON_ID=708627 /ORGANISM="Timspurckia oligopyrenoides, Strain CCMP3278" /LENGTH=237 /DNA_ID=CAMNT_0024639745 /DNA_START=134 /DNA_END=847 /DNA_ORIENTATION=+
MAPLVVVDDRKAALNMDSKQVSSEDTWLRTRSSVKSTGGSHTSRAYVEFVYYDRTGNAHDVRVAGDWNDWSCVSLQYSQPKLWKVVLVVPIGYHEFVYYVDGSPKVSDVHPKTADGMTNWRNIVGRNNGAHLKKPPTVPAHRQALLKLYDSFAFTMSRTSSLASFSQVSADDCSDIASNMSCVSSESDEECPLSVSDPIEHTTSKKSVFSVDKSTRVRVLLLVLFLLTYFAIYLSSR